MKKILCPTDFSETSYNAINYAAKFAQNSNYDLTLLNVQSLFDFTPVEFVTGKQLTIKATSERLKDLCSEVSKIFKLRCTPEIEPTYNRLSTVISEKASHYDLLVMGSNGADDLYQFFMGSNTYNALTKSTTPVMVIPDGHLYTEVKKVVYAFDYLSERRLPMAPLLKFLQPMEAELTVLQVMEEAYSEEAAQDLKELQFILETQAAGHPFKYETIRSADVAGSIDDYIRKTEPDILALCFQHRNLLESIFHKSVIKKISAYSLYPVFVFTDAK